MTLPGNTLLEYNVLSSLINCIFYLYMTVIVCHGNKAYEAGIYTSTTEKEIGNLKLMGALIFEMFTS